MKTLTLLIVFLAVFACSEPRNPESDAEALIQEEITTNSMGVLKDVDLTLGQVNDSTYTATYTLPTGRTISRTYYFDSDITKIKEVDND